MAVRWRYGSAGQQKVSIEGAVEGEKIDVYGSASRCRLCRSKWREAFPDTPDGCFFAGQSEEPFWFFNAETGWPRRCETPDPRPVDLTAWTVLDVLDHTRDQLTGEGAGVSIEAMRSVAAIRGITIDQTFLDLWSVASAEWMTMRSEAVKAQMDKHE